MTEVAVHSCLAIVLGITNLFCAALFSKSVSACLLGKEVSLREAYAFALPKLRSLILAGLIVSIMHSISFIPATEPFHIIPQVFSLLVSLVFLFVPYAIAIENVSAISALKLSWKMVRSDSGNLLVLLLGLFALLVIWVAVVVGIPMKVVGGPAQSGIVGMCEFDSTTRNAFWILHNTLRSFFDSPFVYAVLIVFYYDLRVRKEGFTIEMLAERFHRGGKS